ncbi:MAG: tetratricopeptide repeat protein [Symploca sp. SIO2C1]|nr:tetratricopeptide repeat protein [Symploca sp. SIO2C1]
MRLRKLAQLNQIVTQLYQRGDSEQVLMIAEKSLELSKKLQKRDYYDTANSFNNLAIIYSDKRRYSEAEILYLEALAIWRRLLGDNHINIVQTLNNLAYIYEKQGRYKESETLYVEALDIRESLLGSEHLDVALSLNNLGGIYTSQGRYKEAEPLYVKALDIRESLLGSEHLDVALSLNNLGGIYTSQGRYKEAEPLYVKALDIRESLLGSEHLDVASSFNNLAFLHYSQGHYLESEALYLKALDMRKRLLKTEEHPDIATSLNNLGALYEDQGRYLEAEQKYLKALAMRQHFLGKQHPYVATTLNNLAELYKDQGRFVDAERKYLEALAILQHLLGNQHPYVATTLNNLAELYKDQGRFVDAEQKHLEALSMEQRLFGDEHPSVARSLKNLATLYVSQGRYSEAEQKYLEALSMRQRLLGNEHPSIATNLDSLAILYVSQGRYSEAEQKYLEALSMRQRLLGNEHPSIATSLNNIATLYASQRRYSEAEQKSIEALSMRQRLLGNEHPSIATSLNNIATLYASQRRYSEAEQKSIEALSMQQNLLGNEHPDVAVSLNNLAAIYANQGRYLEAEERYSKALSMRQNLLGNEHPSLVTSLNNLAAVFATTGCSTKSLSNMLQANKIDDQIINDIFAFSSEGDRLAYLKTIRGNFHAFLSLVCKCFSNSPQAVQKALDVILKRKVLTASALAVQNEVLYSDRYPHLTEDFHKLRDLSEQIIYLTFSIPQTTDFTTYQQQLAQLQAEHNNLQKNLASQVPEIQLQEQLPNRSDIASKLPAGSILVEFVRFDVFNFKAIPAKGEAQWQPARYLAFILPAGQPESVEMIDIGEAEYIDSLIREFRGLVSGTGTNPENQLGMFNKRNSKLIFREYHPQAGSKLGQAIFDKLRPYIQEHQHLIIAPDGELNLVPFQILPSDDSGKKMLMDEFTISYLTVGRDILRQKVETKRTASLKALVLASPNFDLNAETVTPQASPEQQNMHSANLRESIASNPLKPATGTGILGERIAQKLNVAPYLEDQALENYFNPRQCPRILLVATHGLFLPNQPEDPTPTPIYHRESDLLQRDRISRRVENPMLRSALALAGANTWAKGGKLPPEAGKGILFAQDVAGLDLWANEITVLSACETGIGDIAIGEGVFGLRRAFAVAGAKTLIMSLWSVNGWTTTLLMERFFDNCEAGLGRTMALQEAQNYLRNITVRELQQFELGQDILKYEFNNGRKLDAAILARQAEDKPLAHPKYWGAWICQGETKAVEIFKLDEVEWQDF